MIKTIIIYGIVWLAGVWFGYAIGSAPTHNDWD